MITTLIATPVVKRLDLLFSSLIFVLLLSCNKTEDRIETKNDENFKSKKTFPLVNEGKSKVSINELIHRLTVENLGNDELFCERIVVDLSRENLEQFFLAVEKLDVTDIRKQELKAAAIATLCKNGEHKFLLSFISENLAHGADRNNLLREVFAAQSSLSVGELLRLRSSLESPDDKMLAYEGIATSAFWDGSVNNDLYDYIFSIEGRKLDAGEEKLLLESIVTQFQKDPFSEHDHLSESVVVEKFEQLSKMFSKGLINTTVIQQCLSSLSNNDSDMAFEQYSKLVKSGLSVDDNTLKTIITKMIHNNSLGSIAKLKQSNLPTSMWENISYELVKKNIAEAAKWYEMESNTFTAAESNYIHKAFARQALDENDLESASKWLSIIQDDKIAKDVTEQYKNKYLQKIEQEASKDPLGVINTVLSDTDNSFDESLQIAMSSYIKKDVKSAQSWFSENSNNLNDIQTSHVALAFAREAIRMGDTVIAREWANIVNNKKLKEVLIGEIAAKED